MATSLDPTAVSLDHSLQADVFVLLFGNEANGPAQEWIDLPDLSVTISMPLRIVLLNVAVTAGIIRYEFTRTG